MSGQAFTLVLSYATLLAQPLVIVLLILFIRDWRTGERDAFTGWLHRAGLWLAAFVALVAMAGSLIYSEIIGFAPCTLCWYQRICMYPQVILLGMAAWMRDRRIVRYALALSVIGGLVALDHVWYQMGGGSLIPCAANGPTCDIRFVYELGYVTIPMMALTAFALIGTLLLHASDCVRKR